MSIYRDRKITFKVTAEEFELIEAAASIGDHWGAKTISRFIRKTIVEKINDLEPLVSSRLKERKAREKISHAKPLIGPTKRR